MKNFILITFCIISIFALAEPPKLGTQQNETAPSESCSRQQDLGITTSLYCKNN